MCIRRTFKKRFELASYALHCCWNLVLLLPPWSISRNEIPLPLRKCSSKAHHGPLVTPLSLKTFATRWAKRPTPHCKWAWGWALQPTTRKQARRVSDHMPTTMTGARCPPLWAGPLPLYPRWKRIHMCRYTFKNSNLDMNMKTLN